jgi:hypothetical protein
MGDGLAVRGGVTGRGRVGEGGGRREGIDNKRSAGRFTASGSS